MAKCFSCENEITDEDEDSFLVGLNWYCSLNCYKWENPKTS